MLNYSILSRNILGGHSFELSLYTYDTRLRNIAIYVLMAYIHEVKLCAPLVLQQNQLSRRVRTGYV